MSMIEVSVQSGGYGWSPAYLNVDHIESIAPRVDARAGEPQTIVTMRSGDKLRVRERASEVHADVKAAQERFEVRQSPEES